MVADSILSIKNLSVAYHVKGEDLTVLDDINLDIKKGEVLGLVGESGSGKSTLGRAILRLLPESAGLISGSISYKREELTQLSEKEINNKIRGNEIAMVMQNPQNALNPVFTVGRQIVDVLYFKEKKTANRQVSRRKLKPKAVDILKKVGISDPEYRFAEYPHELSGGMKQRVMLAMAFISSPSLLIADEPTTALDLTVEAQILKLLADLVEEYQTSILYISHDLRVVAGLSDRIAVMYAGKLVELAEADELFSRPNHPYTQALIECLPDPERGKRLNTIPGQVPDLGDYPSGCSFHPRCRHCFEPCPREVPPLEEVGPGHLSACFLNRKADGGE